jgi:hypothetical protein
MRYSLRTLVMFSLRMMLPLFVICFTVDRPMIWVCSILAVIVVLGPSLEVW